MERIFKMPTRTAGSDYNTACEIARSLGLTVIHRARTGLYHAVSAGAIDINDGDRIVHTAGYVPADTEDGEEVSPTFNTIEPGTQFGFPSKPFGMKQDGWIKTDNLHYREAANTDAYKWRVYEDFPVVIEDLPTL